MESHKQAKREKKESKREKSLSCVWLFVTPWIAARQASLSISNSQSSLKLISIQSVMPSSHLILCHPLLLLPPIPPSIRVFSKESTLRMRWPKYWSFSWSSIIPSNEHPGLISFRMDWLDHLAVRGTLKSLLQHHSSRASILRPWDFPGKSTRVSCCCLLQDIFPTQYPALWADTLPAEPPGNQGHPQIMQNLYSAMMRSAF